MNEKADLRRSDGLAAPAGQDHITAFYLEALLLIVVFIGIILVLTRVFGMARTRSEEAKVKTSAVCLAENAAACFAGAETGSEIFVLLNEDDNASWIREGDEDGEIRASYQTDMTPAKDGRLVLTLSWTEEEGMRRAVIDVEDQGKSPVYSLETSRYIR